MQRSRARMPVAWARLGGDRRELTRPGRGVVRTRKATQTSGWSRGESGALHTGGGAVIGATHAVATGMSPGGGPHRQGRDESARWDPAGGVFWKVPKDTDRPAWGHRGENWGNGVGGTDAKRRCPGAAELRGDKAGPRRCHPLPRARRGGVWPECPVREQGQEVEAASPARSGRDLRCRGVEK